jgi:hypothetical protein
MRARIASILLLVAVAGAAPATAQSGPATVNVSNARGASTAPAVAIDADDTFHLAWADAPGSADGEEPAVYYARSFDGGVTFESPRPVSPASGIVARPREVRVVAADSGAVALAWWAPVPEDDGRAFVTAFFALSADGGATFAPAVATSVRYRDDGAAKEGFRNTTSLSLAAGPDGAFAVAATVPDVFRGFNVYVARTADGATFADAVKVSDYPLVIPRAASNAIAYLPGGELYVVWSVSRGDFVDQIREVMFAVSDDGGRRFTGPAQLARVRGIVGGLARAGDATALVVQSQKNERALAITKVFRSSNGGRSYGPRARVAKSASYNHFNQSSLAANADGVVALAWTENSSRPGPPEGLYVAVSRDGGRSFDEPALVAPGLFIDPPAVTVDSAGRVGLAFSSSDASVEDREVLFMRVPE